MTRLGACVLAALVTAPWLRDMARSGLVRPNYRGRELAFPAGAVLVACSLLALDLDTGNLNAAGFRLDLLAAPPP